MFPADSAWGCFWHGDVTVANWDIHSVSANEEEEERGRRWQSLDEDTFVHLWGVWTVLISHIKTKLQRYPWFRGSCQLCWTLSQRTADFSPIFIRPCVLQQAGRPRLFANGRLCLFTGLTKIINSSREMGTHTPVLLLHPRVGREKQRQALKEKKKK